MQDRIVVMICDSADTVTRKIQVVRLDYVLCMVIINYLYSHKNMLSVNCVQYEISTA
jgi:hypothetical protein